jgi:hypothetical protein
MEPLELPEVRSWDELRWDSEEPLENKGKERPHDPLVCGMDFESDCDRCRMKFYGRIKAT